MARVGKTHIPLDTIIIALTNGATAEEIAHQYPSIQLANIYSVIGYYLCHRAEVDAYLQQHANRASKFAS